MYENFFGLKARPFTKTPDPSFLYHSRSHEEALARLQYAVEEKEIILLTGDVGCGKTTITRALMDSLKDGYRVLLILNPRLLSSEFLRVVARRLDIRMPSGRKDELLEAVHERLYRDHEAGITPVLIIDEAQLIPTRETFEEIRLLTNFQLDDTNLLSLILVGQTELRRKLRHKALEPLRQRIGLFYHIGPLTEQEVREYISHRLRVAGTDEVIFTEKAIRLIHRYAAGVPRLVNSLCNSALLEGFGAGRKLIEESLIEAASRELGLRGGPQAPFLFDIEEKRR